MNKRVAVIGAGVSGMACALRLRQASGLEVEVHEAAAQPGGVTQSSQRDGFRLECGPDSMLSIKPAALGLLRELGLEAEIQSTRPQARTSLIARGRRLIPVPEGVYLMAPGRMLPFARSPLISWPGKLRMGLDLILPRRNPELPEESLAAFVRRRLGREGLERLAQPLIGGIYTANPERLSLAATMPQFVDMERSHRSLILAMRARSQAMGSAAASGPRYGLFVTLRSGLGRLSQVMAEGLGDVLHCDSVATSCRRRPAGGWILGFADGRAQDYDQVVLALPAHRSAALLEGDDLLSRLLGGIAYANIATVNIALRREDIGQLPQAAGFVVPAVDHHSLIACTFVDQKYEHRAPEGCVLLRAFCGGAMHPEDLQCSDEALVNRVLAEIDWRFGLRRAPLFTQVNRWPRAMAQYELGHQRRCDLIDGALALRPGLHLIGNGLRGVGIPDVVQQGWNVAERILSASAVP
ncbi:MAG: protoporphyrinogen oxidase [Planctomycetota bacterium]|nr:MAG: protoporphyrinogen oxidase [Planctomycetota bacterium]